MICDLKIYFSRERHSRICLQGIHKNFSEDSGCYQGMNFTITYNSLFLDLEHLPDEDSFQKASQLVTRAVTADKDKEYETAVQLYQESLEYFLPIVHYEPDTKKRDKLRSTVSGYQRRCRELRSRASGGGSQTGTRHNQLIGLCRTNSHLMTGLEICIQGEDYLTGGEFDMALDRSVCYQHHLLSDL